MSHKISKSLLLRDKTEMNSEQIRPRFTIPALKLTLAFLCELRTMSEVVEEIRKTLLSFHRLGVKEYKLPKMPSKSQRRRRNKS